MAKPMPTDKMKLALTLLLEELINQKVLTKEDLMETYGKDAENNPILVHEHIVMELMHELEKNNRQYSVDDLHEHSTQHELTLQLIAGFIKTKVKDFKFDHTIFSTPTKEFEKDKEKLKERLELNLLNLLTVLNELTPKPENKLKPDQLKFLAKNMANDLSNQTLRYTKVSDNKNVLDTFSTFMMMLLSGLTKSLKNLYGGIDPRFTGGINTPVLTALGNLMGIVDYNGVQATSEAFIDAQNRFDALPDPFGMENAIRQRLNIIFEPQKNTQESRITQLLDVAGVFTSVLEREGAGSAVPGVVAARSRRRSPPVSRADGLGRVAVGDAGRRIRRREADRERRDVPAGRAGRPSPGSPSSEARSRRT